MAESGRSGARWQAKALIWIPALVALGIFIASVVVRSLRDYRTVRYFSVEYRVPTGWEKTRITEVPRFIGIEINTPFPWIWLMARRYPIEEEVVPLNQADETDWVSRIPEAKDMETGKLLEPPTDKTALYYDEKARKFVSIRFRDGHGDLKNKWFKLLIDGTIVEVR